jgi:hypothetical protein
MPQIQQKRFTATTPGEAFIQHLHEKAALHWPRKDLSKPKANQKSSSRAPGWFNRQTAAAPGKAHRVAPKKKFSM